MEGKGKDLDKRERRKEKERSRKEKERSRKGKRQRKKERKEKKTERQQKRAKERKKEERRRKKKEESRKKEKKKERKKEERKKKERNAKKVLVFHSHFHSFDLDSPRVRCLVQGLLHDVTDGFTLAQDLSQVLGAQHVAQGRRSKQVGGVTERRKNVNFYQFFKKIWHIFLKFLGMVVLYS